MKQALYPPNAPKAGGAYSPGLRVGDFVFVAGQVPRDPATGQIVGSTIEEQTEQVIKNVIAILEAGGATLADVVKVSAHLSSMDLFDGYNKVYEGYFPEPRPVRTTVGSELKGFLVEIDAIAYVGEK
jgi:2-iminobutanoate/2-iminopropanoate deaminase